jgi:hypothetical protein
MNIVGDLTYEEAKELESYVFSNRVSSFLCEITNENDEIVPTVYRGTKMKKSEIKTGGIYRHWNLLSSWSIERNVSIGFCLEDYIPEELQNEINEEIVPVLLIAKEQRGLIINNFIEYGCFKNEKEVIIHSGEWIIEHVEKEYEGNKEYYILYVNSFI